jgi:putative redox protein
MRKRELFCNSGIKNQISPVFRANYSQIIAMDTHFVSTNFKGGMAFTSHINEHSLLTDTTPEHGGNNEGPGPKRLMLVSLAGCTGIDVVGILNKMKVVFSDLSIDTTATLSESHPRTYTHVKVSYKIKLPETERPKMEKAVQLSQDKYCGVMAMFKTFAKIETEIIYL